MVMARDLSFAQAVDELLAWASRATDQHPSTARALVFESTVGPGQDDTYTSAGPVDDYEPRWREVLDRVDRDWINLRVFPTADGGIGILVEYVDSGGARKRRQEIAITYGGSLVSG